MVCYQSQFGHMGFGNWKPIKVFELSKKNNSIVDNLCQQCVKNGKCVDIELREMLIFHNKRKKKLKIHASIFERLINKNLLLTYK